jgi:predicted transcriptional regulator YdeE
VAFENVTQNKLVLIGVETPASNAQPERLGEFWAEFFRRDVVSATHGRVRDAPVAVYCEYEGDHTKPYTFFLGCEVAEGTEPPSGFVKREIPGGTYAHFAAEGKQPEALVETWKHIWQLGLRRTFRADYEVHNPKTPLKIDIFVGLEP